MSTVVEQSSASIPSSSARRRPELDGVRGVAIVLVLVGHAFAGPLAQAGVTLFFGLSGYLITGILLKEYAKTGRINFPQFYWRRFTRLFPPMALLVAGMCLLQRGLPWDSILGPLTWTTNYLRLAGFEVAFTKHTWSLAVEEQFYLVWPLLLLLITRCRKPSSVVALLVIGLMLWRIGLEATGHHFYAYHALETAGVTILAGCWVAWAGWKVSSSAVVYASVAGLFAVPIALRLVGQAEWISVAVTPLVVVVVAGAGAARLLTGRAIGFFGVASYSLYLWHTPGYLYLGQFGVPVPVGTLVGSLVGVAAYRWFERPIMEWRERNRR